MWINVLTKFHNIGIAVRKEKEKLGPRETWNGKFYNIREW